MWCINHGRKPFSIYNTTRFGKYVNSEINGSKKPKLSNNYQIFYAKDINYRKQGNVGAGIGQNIQKRQGL